MNTWMPVFAESEHVVQDKHLPLMVSALIADLMKSLFSLEAQTDISVRDKFVQMKTIDSSDPSVETIHTVN
jgi:hypothetical protein